MVELRRDFNRPQGSPLKTGSSSFYPEMYFELAEITASPWVLMVWGILVGFVFSTVGAAGGILASVGMISVFGVQDPNLVKPMVQTLTLATPLIAVPLYMRQCRVVYRLAFLLAAGGIIGAIIGSTLSHRLLSDMSVFKPVFAVLIFYIAGQLAWQIFCSRGKTPHRTRAIRAAEVFERKVKNGQDPCATGVRCVHKSFTRLVFQFGNEEFAFSPWLPLFAGMSIAILSSALGVGGGFLLVPFMSIVLRLPMYVIAGTSALAIAVHSLTSIGNYIRLGIELDLTLLGIMLVGIVAGSAIGPAVSKYMPENGLRGFLCIVLVLIGLRYTGAF